MPWPCLVQSLSSSRSCEPAVSVGSHVCKLGPIRNVLDKKGMERGAGSSASRDFVNVAILMVLAKILVELEVALADVQGFDSGIQRGRWNSELDGSTLGPGNSTSALGQGGFDHFPFSA